MGFILGESPLRIQKRVAKACHKSLRNLKNQFRPKKKIVVKQGGHSQNKHCATHGT